MKNGRKKLSLTDVLGFAWYAFVAMSMVHQGNAARLGGATADMSIVIPMYAVAVLLLLAVVLRISFGKWQGVRRLYALIVAGVAVGPFGFNLLDRDSSFEIVGTWYGKLPYDRHADYLLFKELTEGK